MVLTMKLVETTVIRVDPAAHTARHVEDFPSLGDARAAARKLGAGHETLPTDVWHTGVGIGFSEWIEEERRGRWL